MMTLSFDGAFYESFDGFKLRKGKERKTNKKSQHHKPVNAG